MSADKHGIKQAEGEFVRRGTMVYTNDNRPGKAKLLVECESIVAAEDAAERLNKYWRKKP